MSSKASASSTPKTGSKTNTPRGGRTGKEAATSSKTPGKASSAKADNGNPAGPAGGGGVAAGSALHAARTVPHTPAPPPQKKNDAKHKDEEKASSASAQAPAKEEKSKQPSEPPSNRSTPPPERRAVVAAPASPNAADGGESRAPMLGALSEHAATQLAASVDADTDATAALLKLLEDPVARAQLAKVHGDRVALGLVQRALTLSDELASQGEALSLTPIARDLLPLPNDAGADATASSTITPSVGSGALSSSFVGLSGAGFGSSRSFSSVDTEALRSFVSSTAVKTLEHTEQDPGVPYLEFACSLLFIDISGYSSVTTALESKGPFALSEAVNTYLATVLSIVDDWRGDVLSFAGDAVVVAFSEQSCPVQSAGFALMCADELIRRCGTYEVPASGGRTFSLHIGAAGGKLRSQVFQRPGAKAMQSSFPFITGQPMIEVGDAVDAAKRGEIALPAELAKQVREQGRIKFESVAIEGSPGMERVVKCESETDLQTEFDGELLLERPEGTEEQLRRFVHPAVYRRLQHTSTATNIAELRFLSVMFIGMLSGDTQTTARDWFSEVSAVLDEHECPVLQVIDDDKGVHVVAAVSLVFVDREAASTATVIAKRLQEQEVGCAVGIAAGQVFCGVVGAETACRWDITGPACVRACRLMQLAKLAAAADAGLEERHASVADVQLAVGHSVLADASVYAHADKALLQEAGKASVKGTPDPIALYTLAAVDTRALSLLPQDFIYGFTNAFEQQFAEIKKLVDDDANRQRFAAVLHGPTGCGKATLGLRVCRAADLMVISITCVRGSTTVQVAQGLAQWYRYHRSPVLRQKAVGVLESLEKRHHLKALRQALELVDYTVAYGMHTAIIVRAAQFVDETSLSFANQAVSRTVDPSDSSHAKLQADLKVCLKMTKNTFGSGRFGVFYCVTPVYGAVTWKHVIGQGTGKRPIIAEIGSISEKDYMQGFSSFGFSPSDRFAGTLHSHAKGNYEAIGAIGNWLASLRPFISKVDVYSVGTLPPSAERRIRSTTYLTFSPAICAKVVQQIDVLSPALRTTVRVIAQGLDHQLFDLRLEYLVTAMSRLIKRGFSEDRLVRELKTLEDLHIIDLPLGADLVHGVISFKHPATPAVLNAMTSPSHSRDMHRVFADVLEEEISHSKLPLEEQDPMLPLAITHHLRRAGRHADAWRALAAGWKRYLETFPSDSNVCDDFLGTENVYSRVLEQMKEEYGEEVADAQRQKKGDEMGPMRSKRKADEKPGTLAAAAKKKKSALGAGGCFDGSTTCQVQYSKYIFGNAPRMPELHDFPYEPHADVPFAVLNAKNHRPSLALGPLMYYVIDLGWSLRTIFFLVANGLEVPADYVEFLNGMVDRYMAQVKWYDGLCQGSPSATPPPDSGGDGDEGDKKKEHEAAAAERASKQKELEAAWAAERETVLGFIKPREKFNTAAADEYMTYVTTKVQERADRGQAFVLKTIAEGAEASLDGVSLLKFQVYSLALAKMFPALAAELFPFDRVADELSDTASSSSASFGMYAGGALFDSQSGTASSGKTEFDDDGIPHLRREGLCEGLMTLAASNWKPVHPRVGLQFVREQCLWSKTQPMDAFAAFVWFHRELESASGGSGATDDAKHRASCYVPLKEPTFQRMYITAEHCKPRTPPATESSAASS